VYGPDGALYFTDPPYGLPKRDADPAKELKFNGVFRFAKGQLQAVVQDIAVNVGGDNPHRLGRQVLLPPRHVVRVVDPGEAGVRFEILRLGFGADIEMEDLPVGADEDEASVMSRLGSNFDSDDSDVQPDEEEAASLETLAEEDDYDDDEEDEDDLGVRRPIKPKPTKPLPSK